MINYQETIIRKAKMADAESINDLIRYGSNIHRHLDWRQPTEWIGQTPFLLLERNYRLMAALACLRDLEETAWVRLFAANSMIEVDDAWRVLWREAKEFLDTKRVEVAAIAYHDWFKQTLDRSEFRHIDDVIPLEWESRFAPPKTMIDEVLIRRIVPEDLHAIYKIDQSAFHPPWQLSKEILRVAVSKSSLTTVAVSSGKVIGYQISTVTQSIGHLARLAVLPEWQGRGIGHCLVQNMLSKIFSLGTRKVTVNTQADNTSSLALYHKVGFKRLSTIYPVYRYRQ
jgi:ribosomal-protein-alanine N-acetyltransferase